MKDSKARGKRSWGIALFGMTFVLVGVLVFFSTTGTMAYRYFASANWVQVPVQIHQLKLSRNTGGDSTTYRIESRYSYRFRGTVFESSRVSLSDSSDNIGSYWQDLYRQLSQMKKYERAVALVNPDDPGEAYLDRTFRWGKVIFSSVFLVMFGGVGGLFAWLSLQRSKGRVERLQDEAQAGIACDQKSASWFLAGFGGLFFLVGIGFSALALPQAIRNGEYAALLILLFVFIGAGILYYAWKERRAYKRFGPTALFLDPPEPGVGGKFGGTFKLNIPKHANVTAPLTAKLTCTKLRKSGDDTSRSIKWQQETAVYLKQTSSGQDASVLIDIPEVCLASKEWENRSAIVWDLTVEGDYNQHGLGKLKRSWTVEIADHAAQASTSLHVPDSFIKKSQQVQLAQAEVSANKQLDVAESEGMVDIKGLPGNSKWQYLLGIVVGGVFFGTGIFTLGEWIGAYIFILIGAFVALASLYSFGSAVEVKIDKSFGILYTRQSWFGIVYAHRQADVLDAGQFKIVKTSSVQSGSNYTEYYAIKFSHNNKDILLAKDIEGKHSAEVLMNSIIEKCFDQPELVRAA